MGSDYREKKVPAWVVQEAVAHALSEDNVRGIDHYDANTYKVMVVQDDDD